MRDFALPRIRSTGFRSYPCDLWRLHTISLALAGCGLLLSLSLPSHHIDTLPASCFKMNDATFAASYYHHAVSGTFHTQLWVLCSFPSRYYCAIGLGTYLGFEVNAPILHEQYPMLTTLELYRPFHHITTGLSPSKASHSREIRLRWRRL